MYTWDYFDLLKRRNLLIRLSKRKDLKPFTKDMIQSDLLLYDCLCEIGNVTSNFPFLVRTEASKRYQETKITSSMINPTSFQKILDLAVFLNRIQFPIIEKNYQNQNLSIEDSIELAKPIYQEFGNPYLNIFQKVVDPNTHILEVTSQEQNSTNWLGLTIHDFTTSGNFIKLYLDHTIVDMVTLGHEVLHLCSFQGTKFQKMVQKNLLLRETDGKFFDFTAIHSFCSTKYQEDAEYLFYQELLTFVTAIEKLYTRYYLQRERKNSKTLDEALVKVNYYFEEAKLNLQLTEENFYFIFDETADNILTDIISFLTALEMREKYKHDPERTIRDVIHIVQEKGTVERIFDQYQIPMFEDNFKTFKKTIQY